jgi:endogenous inhibitor of DNA gyrase (YacG/DUF329 family)
MKMKRAIIDERTIRHRGRTDKCPICHKTIMWKSKNRFYYISVDMMKNKSGIYEWCCSHNCAELFILEWSKK